MTGNIFFLNEDRKYFLLHMCLLLKVCFLHSVLTRGSLVYLISMYIPTSLVLIFLISAQDHSLYGILTGNPTKELDAVLEWVTGPALSDFQRMDVGACY